MPSGEYLQATLKLAVPTALWTQPQDLYANTLPSRFQMSGVYWSKALDWSSEALVTVSVWNLVAL